MNRDGINPMENFAGTTTYISHENNPTWGCLVYVSDAILQENIAVLPQWGPRSNADIYFCYLPFHAGSLALVLNP